MFNPASTLKYHTVQNVGKCDTIQNVLQVWYSTEYFVVSNLLKVFSSTQVDYQSCTIYKILKIDILAVQVSLVLTLWQCIEYIICLFTGTVIVTELTRDS